VPGWRTDADNRRPAEKPGKHRVSQRLSKRQLWPELFKDCVRTGNEEIYMLSAVLVWGWTFFICFVVLGWLARKDGASLELLFVLSFFAASFVTLLFLTFKYIAS
jgi:hypothetical protein